MDDPLPPIIPARFERKGALAASCLSSPSLLGGKRPTIEQLELAGDSYYQNIPADQLLSLPTARGTKGLSLTHLSSSLLVGLCPELRQVFSLTMTTGPLPFPSKSRLGVEDKVIPTLSKEEEEEEKEPEDVEVTRFGDKQRLSEAWRRSSMESGGLEMSFEQEMGPSGQDFSFDQSEYAQQMGVIEEEEIPTAGFEKRRSSLSKSAFEDAVLYETEPSDVLFLFSLLSPSCLMGLIRNQPLPSLFPQV